MHQNASKCIKMYAEYIILMFWEWNFNLKNFIFLVKKWLIFFLSAQNASICIRMHQNVSRMNCANVLCMKLSKKLFLLDLKGPKFMKYIYLFMVVHPVYTAYTLKIFFTSKLLRSAIVSFKMSFKNWNMQLLQSGAFNGLLPAVWHSWPLFAYI